MQMVQLEEPQLQYDIKIQWLMSNSTIALVPHPICVFLLEAGCNKSECSKIDRFNIVFA